MRRLQRFQWRTGRALRGAVTGAQPSLAAQLALSLSAFAFLVVALSELNHVKGDGFALENLAHWTLENEFIAEMLLRMTFRKKRKRHLQKCSRSQ